MKSCHAQFCILAILLFLLTLFSCVHRNTNHEITAELEVIIDTLSIYPSLAEAPLITFFETAKWNSRYTGRTLGWEERERKCYADSLQTILKTMLVEDAIEISETAMPLRNDIPPQRAPVLLLVKGPKQNMHQKDGYWSEYSVDSVSAKICFEQQIDSLFDCHFGPSSRLAITKASYPIELKDTVAFRPVMRIDDKEKGVTYSPLFECYFRGKSMLICSFDVDSLKTTQAGRYLWDVIRNYSYAKSFRNEVRDHVKEMDDDTWYDTMIPVYKNKPGSEQ